MTVMSSVATEVFRARYHVEVIPPSYDGRRHAAINLLLVTAPIMLALQILSSNWDPGQAWIVPVFLLASVVEFAFHRRRGGVRRAFNAAPQRDRPNHHQYFSSSAMSIG